MDKELAVELMKGLKKCRDAIDEVEATSRNIQDEEFRLEFHKILGRISLDLYSKAMGKIILRHPELDPYSEEALKKMK